jgi:hypothetical protein
VAPIILPFRPNKLAFPGTKPGIDPTHPASGKYILLSAVPAVGQQNYVNSATSQPLAVISGTVAPTVGIDGVIGPWVRVASSSGQCLGFSLSSISDNPSVTIASIFNFTVSTGGFQAIVSNSGGNQGLFLQDVTPKAFFTGSGGPVSAPFSLVAGSTYFLAHSLQTDSSGAVANFVARNLATGSIQTGSVISSTGTGARFGTNCTVGNDPFSEWLNAKLAAAMVSTASLSIPQLLQWADDPWSFWYPRAIGLAGMLRGSIAAAVVVKGSTLPMLGVG